MTIEDEMGLLQEHFERIKNAEQAGKKVRHAVCFDIMGTMMSLDGKINRPLIVFAQWNFSKKLLGSNHLVSKGSMGYGLLNSAGLDEATTGISGTESKSFVFEEAAKDGETIALLIDDMNPVPHGMQPVTWWNPNKQDVRDFLERKLYEDFSP